MNIVDEIQAIAAREAASDAPYLAARLDKAFAELLGPGIGNSLEKLYGRVVIRIGGEGLAEDGEELRRLRALDVAAAPELLALIAAGDRRVLIARYWACEDEPLVQIDDDEARVVTAAALARFERDMTVLADHGSYHPYAGEGYDSWWIGERSGTIVLDNWTALEPLESFERDKVLGEIKKLVDRLRP